MANKKDGGPAFPNQSDSSGYGRAPGLSLRDYFAGQALMGLIAYNRREDDTEPEHFASRSYALADAMLKERDRG